ncbi:MAG TPA: PilZ domain-containing protein [Polyangia bacterium]|jgi:c-di-GMP-binding flagellar brake protein YcgR|nr:PilZ domain-containing protein [Polyangia bacterium]
MSIDRRRTPRDRRQGPRIAATFAVKQSFGDRVELCQAEDISPGGMAIKRLRDRSQSPRSPVALHFQLPGTHEEITAEAVVTHDASAGSFRRTGVGFIALRPEQQQAIAAFCRRAATPRRARVR